MKKLVLLTLLLAACSPEGSSKSEGVVIAEVNGTEITKPEIEKVLATFTGLQTAKLEDYPADFQKEFLNKYIEKKLLLEAGRDAGQHGTRRAHRQLDVEVSRSPASRKVVRNDFQPPPRL